MTRLPRRAALAALGALAALLLPPLAGRAAAQGEAEALPLEILRDEADYDFAEQLRFRLEARSQAEPAAPIEEVLLRYTVAGSEVRNRRLPELTPGTTVQASHEESLSRGAIPPTAEIRWWWELEDAEGRRATTEPRSIRYLDSSFAWEVLDEADLGVWYYGEGGGAPDPADDALAADVAAMAREHLDALAEIIGRPVDRRIEIVLFREQEDLRPNLAARGSVYESRLATLGARVAPDVIVLDTGSIARSGARDDLDPVIAHELSHVVLNLRNDYDWLGAPAWLDEGLAMFAEEMSDGPEQKALERATEADDLMSVRSLSSFPGDASRVSQAYGQSRDFVAFLVQEHEPERFARLLDGIAAGELTIDEALEAAYGFDQDGMYESYRRARGLAPALTPTPDPAPIPRRSASPSQESPLPCTGGLGLLGLALLAPLAGRHARRREPPR